MMFDSVKLFHALVASFSLLHLVASIKILNTRENSTQATLPATGFPPCDALIAAGLGDRVLLATSDAYETRVQSWYAANGRLRPWCFVLPRTTQEVSVVVSTLAEIEPGAGDWHVAVRSGGHGPPGTNNIANGVTIDLGMMNRSWYDPDQNLASVEPGGKWKDVYYDLLHNGNVTVTGGRDGDVGVGGFLLGGGNSYYSPRNGFGCDTVINFEVVLANGSIVQANAAENSDLFKVLKGGSLNFGLVTRFDLEAMPAVDLAYGQSVFASNYSNEFIDAVVEFTNHPEELNADSLIALYMHDTSVSEDVTIILIRTNSKGNLNTTSFDTINKIPALTSYWGHKSLADAANESQIAGGTKNVGATLTLLNTPSILRQAVDLHSQLVSTLGGKIGADNFVSTVIFQPLPTFIAAIGERKGGNVLGLDRITTNAILLDGGIAVTNGDDAAFAIAQAEFIALIEKLKQMGEADGTVAEWTYLNYADTSQDPLGSYGSKNVALIKEAAEKFDPRGFWQTMVPGGFKILRVAA